jgi:hypothetical protein
MTGLRIRRIRLGPGEFLSILDLAFHFRFRLLG